MFYQSKLIIFAIKFRNDMIYKILKIQYCNKHNRKVLDTLAADPNVIIYSHQLWTYRSNDTLDYGFEFSVWLDEEQAKRYSKYEQEFGDDCYEYDKVPQEVLDVQTDVREDIKRLGQADDELFSIYQKYKEQ